MKELVKMFIVSLVFGTIFTFGLCYAAGVFESDSDYKVNHPEVMELENWESYFKNPKEVK